MNATPVAPASPEADSLDAAALARLRELDPDGRHGVLVRVLTAYESSLNRLLAQLEAARTQGDPAAVAAVAHTLKSSSASVGALGLAATCARAEARLRAADLDALHDDVDQMLLQGRAALRTVGAMLRP